MTRAGDLAVRPDGSGSGRHAAGNGEDARPIRLRVEEVGECLVASVGGAQASAARAVARMLPGEEARVCVVMPRLHRRVMPELVRQLRAWVPIRWESVRLVAAGAGDPAHQPLAQELADGLGVEVIAADGDIVCVPGGSLFVAGGGSPDRSAGRGTWWRFRPGREPQQLGRRFPEPEWERALDAMPASQFGHLPGVVIEEVPCGLWIHRPGPVAPDDLVFAVPTHRADIALVVSRPGDHPLPAADVRHLVAQLPAALRDHLVLVPYGDEPIEDARLGAIGSEAANHTLRVRSGLPLHLVGEGHQVVAIGRNGALGWRPFAIELAWRPYGGARVHRWLSPAEDLLPLGPAQLALNDRWMVEIVEAGLWIRSMDRLDGASIVRELAVDSRYCSVIVGAPDSPSQRPPWRAIVRLLRELPAHARSRLRLAVPEGSGEHMARSAARLQARLSDGPAWLLRDGGRLLPLDDLPPEDLEADDERDIFPALVEDSSEVARLLSFVEDLRRIPAWDEQPDAQPRPDYPPPPDRQPFDHQPTPQRQPRPDHQPSARPGQPPAGGGHRLRPAHPPSDGRPEPVPPSPPGDRSAGWKRLASSPWWWSEPTVPGQPQRRPTEPSGDRVEPVRADTSTVAIPDQVVRRTASSEDGDSRGWPRERPR